MKYLFLISMFFILSCGKQETSSLQGLGADGLSINMALVLGGPNGLEGVPTDVKELSKLLRDPIYKMGVYEDGVATVDRIKEATARFSTIETNSLLWYFSGHGGGGSFLAEGDGSMTYKEVTDIIQQVRANKPLKRLLFVLDTCEAGHAVDGNGAIIAGFDKALNSYNIKTKDGEIKSTLYEQAFVFAASTKDETSSDNGVEQGGEFTWKWRKAIEKLRASNPNATIKDVTEETVKTTSGQHPVYKAYPSDQVLNDYFFKY